jgi:hypothetical protein
MGGKTQAGMFMCNGCRDKFTVRTGSVFERSHIPLHKWLLSRILGITYKSAWFMCHRCREAMKPAKPAPLGGKRKMVEADETFIGGKAKNRAFRTKPPKKEAVLTLVERGGESRSFHVANVKAKTLREAIVKTVDRKSLLMTDEGPHYVTVGGEFALHGTVNHSKGEYVGPGGWHINTAESRFSLTPAR